LGGGPNKGKKDVHPWEKIIQIEPRFALSETELIDLKSPFLKRISSC